MPAGKEIDVSDTLPGMFLPTVHTRPVESAHTNGPANEINIAPDKAIRGFLMLAIAVLVILMKKPGAVEERRCSSTSLRVRAA